MTRRRFEDFGRGVLMEAGQGRLAIEAERVVTVERQLIDLWVEPLPNAAPFPPSLALVARMAEHPCAIELFSQPPRYGSVIDCLRKQLALAQMRRLNDQRHRAEALSPFWLLSPGRPKRALDLTKARPMGEGWPRGFYRVGLEVPFFIVVLRELPRVPETRILRLLGRGRVFKGGLTDVRNDPDLWPILEPAVLRWSLEVNERGPTAPEEQELIMQTRDRLEEYTQRVRAEAIEQGLEQGLERGRSRGRREVLLKLLRLKFNSLPEGAEKRVAEASSEELDLWAERILTASSLDELFRRAPTPER